MAKNNNSKRYFKKKAWLYSLENELSENEFINLAGGIEALVQYMKFPFVSLVMDFKKPIVVGHTEGRTIALVLKGHGYEKWQTMEWK